MRAFVNTLDVEDGVDELVDPPALTRWLRERGQLSGGSATKADLMRARTLREALRALLVANNHLEADTDAAALVLAETAARARLLFSFQGARPTLAPDASGVDAALGLLLVPVAEAMSRGTWQRLKACRAETCRWAFYDHARNRSRTWCSMAVCGNRTKAEAYRRRHAA